MTGIPAITVPCGFATDDPGLPIGVQFYARPFDECALLKVADAYESATQWHLYRPVL
jgi:aspartyl-tRNA(Asn)/glutamyl-tRNA(Gln) amidotransferase subunit A